MNHNSRRKAELCIDKGEKGILKYQYLRNKSHKTVIMWIIGEHKVLVIW